MCAPPKILLIVPPLEPTVEQDMWKGVTPSNLLDGE